MCSPSHPTYILKALYGKHPKQAYHISKELPVHFFVHVSSGTLNFRTDTWCITVGRGAFTFGSGLKVHFGSQLLYWISCQVLPNIFPLKITTTGHKGFCLQRSHLKFQGHQRGTLTHRIHGTDICNIYNYIYLPTNLP